jgi:uncharacterized protein (TIGR03437 family)
LIAPDRGAPGKTRVSLSFKNRLNQKYFFSAPLNPLRFSACPQGTTSRGLAAWKKGTEMNTYAGFKRTVPRKPAAHRCCELIGLVALLTVAGLSQTVTGVANAATNLPSAPGLPNSGIAQGALFVVYGSNLGPASLAIATSFPLQRTLGGTSITVTVGGTTVQAIMYYALSTQVAAILPSNAPAGMGTLKLTTGNGSASTPITVVTNNIGVFTLDTTGTGDAVATLPNNTVVTPTNAPDPGDTVVLWATGLGPVTYDETNPAIQFDMTNIPLQVFIGGRPATILFRGRNACCSAVDTIYVTVPPTVNTGCVVSVIMQIGSTVSNATTIPVAASGRTCTPTNPAVSQSDYLRLLAETGPLNLGQVALAQTTKIESFAPTINTASGGGQFERYSASSAALLDRVVDIPAYGSCIVAQVKEAIVIILPGNSLLSPNLDAGASLFLSGSPGGGVVINEAIPKQVSPAGNIAYGASFDTLIPSRYTINGPGGADVGAFEVRVTGPPVISWTNEPSFGTQVSRSAGFPVNWSGGDPQGYVLITGASSSNGIGVSFVCTARTTDGTFTVPANVLEAFPVGNGIAPSQQFAVWGISAPVQFTASGLDLGIATTYTLNVYSDFGSVVY